jgi:hypothetical protein
MDRISWIEVAQPRDPEPAQVTRPEMRRWHGTHSLVHDLVNLSGISQERGRNSSYLAPS